MSLPPPVDPSVGFRKAKDCKPPTGVKRPGIEWNVGQRLEAMDYQDKWFCAKILEVDMDDSTVMVHFDGWNSRYDQWFPMTSDRIRPLSRQSSKLFNEKRRSKREYKLGEIVLAKWTDCRVYPAKVTSLLSDGSFNVMFYDGIQKVVQPINLRPLPASLAHKRELFNTTKLPHPVPPVEVDTSLPVVRPTTNRTRILSGSKTQGTPPDLYNKDGDVLSVGSPSPDVIESLVEKDKKPSQPSMKPKLVVSSFFKKKKSPPLQTHIKPANQRKFPSPESENKTTITRKIPATEQKLQLSSSGLQPYVDSSDSFTSRFDPHSFAAKVGPPRKTPFLNVSKIEVEMKSHEVKKEPDLLEVHDKLKLTPDIDRPNKRIISPPLLSDGTRNNTLVSTLRRHSVSTSLAPCPVSEPCSIVKKERSVSAEMDSKSRKVTSGPLSPLFYPETSNDGFSSDSTAVSRASAKREKSRTVGVYEYFGLAIPPKHEFKIETDHNQYKCPEPGCNKEFRKQTLLDSHIKYYHRKEKTTPDLGGPPMKRRRIRQKTSSFSSSEGDHSNISTVSEHKGQSLIPKSAESKDSSTYPFTDAASLGSENLTKDYSFSTANVASSVSVCTSLNSADPGRHVLPDPSPAPDDIGDTEDDDEEREIVRCVCRKSDENGLMIQCEICSCWQHAACLNLTESTLPDNYVCFVCKNPPGVRDSKRYLYRQEWYTDGRLPTLLSLNRRGRNITEPNRNVILMQNLLRELHNIVAVQRSIKLLLHALKTKDHPEIKFWQKAVEEGEGHDDLDDFTNIDASFASDLFPFDDSQSLDDLSNEGCLPIEGKLSEISLTSTIGEKIMDDNQWQENMEQLVVSGLDEDRASGGRDGGSIKDVKDLVDELVSMIESGLRDRSVVCFDANQSLSYSTFEQNRRNITHKKLSSNGGLHLRIPKGCIASDDRNTEVKSSTDRDSPQVVDDNMEFMMGPDGDASRAKRTEKDATDIVGPRGDQQIENTDQYLAMMLLELKSRDFHLPSDEIINIEESLSAGNTQDLSHRESRISREETKDSAIQKIVSDIKKSELSSGQERFNKSASIFRPPSGFSPSGTASLLADDMSCDKLSSILSSPLANETLSILDAIPADDRSSKRQKEDDVLGLRKCVIDLDNLSQHPNVGDSSSLGIRGCSDLGSKNEELFAFMKSAEPINTSRAHTPQSDNLQPVYENRVVLPSLSPTDITRAVVPQPPSSTTAADSARNSVVLEVNVLDTPDPSGVTSLHNSPVSATSLSTMATDPSLSDHIYSNKAYMERAPSSRMRVANTQVKSTDVLMDDMEFENVELNPSKQSLEQNPNKQSSVSYSSLESVDTANISTHPSTLPYPKHGHSHLGRSPVTDSYAKIDDKLEVSGTFSLDRLQHIVENIADYSLFTDVKESTCQGISVESCRSSITQHIASLQDSITERLDVIEHHVDALEKAEVGENGITENMVSNLKTTLVKVLQDLPKIELLASFS